jgi:hypothetical protein
MKDKQSHYSSSTLLFSMSTNQFADRLRAFGYGSGPALQNNTLQGTGIFTRVTDTVTSSFTSISNRIQGFTPLGEPQEESWFGLSYRQVILFRIRFI